MLSFTERYHFYDGVHHAQIKPYVIWKKNSSYFTRRFITTHNIKCKENERTKFGLEKLETGWKKCIVVENISLITDMENCFTSLTEKRFQESWENTSNFKKTEVFKKIHICNLKLVSTSFYCYFLNCYFQLNDSPSKTMKNVEILRYSSFCISVFPSFSPCHPLQ